VCVCVCVCVLVLRFGKVWCVQGPQGCLVYFYNKPMDIAHITKALLILGKSFAIPFIFIIYEDFDVTQFIINYSQNLGMM